MLTAYTLKLIPNDIAKERLIGHFFREWESEKFQQLAEQYSFEKIDTIVRPEAMERVRWHQEQGDHVVIVSASMECWLTGWCKKKNIELISTQLETIDGRLTGRFATKNCYGVEKANRVKEIYNLEEYDHIYAYGDSRGDRELLALANESFYKPFRARKS
jgi:HAD superfamily hydrolase (TIGR01490 family)